MNTTKDIQYIKEEAHAKINPVLDVTGIREDGYHEVKMILEGLMLHDDVEITASPEEDAVITLTLTGGGPDIPTDGRNIAVKAARLMADTLGMKKNLAIHLTKRIPSAAGLAGGSADAAAVMRALNQLEGEPLSEEELCRLGVKIGADVPYCILGGMALAEGIGEKLTKLPLPKKTAVLLVKPAEGVSTKEIYQSLDRIFEDCSHPDTEKCIADLAAGDLKGLSVHSGNILEEVTGAKLPVISEIEEALLENGAEFAMMSGSGPTVFGMFSQNDKAEAAYQNVRERFADCTVILTSTL